MISIPVSTNYVVYRIKYCNPLMNLFLFSIKSGNHGFQLQIIDLTRTGLESALTVLYRNEKVSTEKK